MANELSISSIVNGSNAIQAYTRNGLQLGSNPIKDYIRFFRKVIPQNEVVDIVYPKSDIEIVYGLVYGLTYNWSLDFIDNTGIQYFSSTVTNNYLSLPNLVIPKGHTIRITNLGDPLDYLIVIASQIYLLEDVNLR